MSAESCGQVNGAEVMRAVWGKDLESTPSSRMVQGKSLGLPRLQGEPLSQAALAATVAARLRAGAISWSNTTFGCLYASLNAEGLHPTSADV